MKVVSEKPQRNQLDSWVNETNWTAGPVLFWGRPIFGCLKERHPLRGGSPKNTHSPKSFAYGVMARFVHGLARGLLAALSVLGGQWRGHGLLWLGAPKCGRATGGGGGGGWTPRVYFAA